MKRPRKKRPESSQPKNGPAIEIIECRPHRITGSLNLNGLEAYPAEIESPIEQLGLWTFMLCGDVKGISAQSERNSIDDPALKKSAHLPDARIELTSGSTLVEFKSRRDALRDPTFSELVELGCFYQRTGQPFQIVTDDQLQVSPRCESVKILRRFVASTVSAERQRQLVQALNDGPRPIRSLINGEPAQTLFRDVCALVANKHLCIDWSAALSFDALVSLPGQPFISLESNDIFNSGRFYRLLQDMAVGRNPQDQRLLEIARSEDRSLAEPSPWGFVEGLPARAHAGHGRIPGSLVADDRRHDFAPDHQTSLIAYRGTRK